MIEEIMSDWTFLQIIEISIVILCFLAPMIIALAILSLVGIFFNELLQLGSGSLLIFVSSFLGIALLTYIEIRLMKWLKK